MGSVKSDAAGRWATIRLVAESHLLQARDWPDFAVERLRSGTIFEATPTGRLPSADAWVQVDGASFPSQDTSSRTSGFPQRAAVR